MGEVLLVRLPGFILLNTERRLFDYYCFRSEEGGVFMCKWIPNAEETAYEQQSNSSDFYIHLRPGQ